MPLVYVGRSSKPLKPESSVMVTKKPSQESQAQQAFGHENSRQSYNVVIVSLTSIRAYIWIEFQSFAKDLGISVSEFESLYDWVITEAVSKVLSLNNAKVLYHYRQDVYKCAYDVIGYFAEYAISKQISAHNLRFLDKETVKVMVAGDNLILARGVIPNDRF